MGRRLPQLLALLSVLTALAATGCGGDRSNLIPSQRAQELTTQLDALKAQIDAGRCDGIAQKVDTFHADATALPNTVDRRLRRRINDGAKALQQHASTTCRNTAAKLAAEQQDQTPTESAPETTTTETTTTDTTPTTSTPTTSTPTDTTPPSTDTPPDTGGGTGAPSDTTPGDTGSGGGGSGSGDGISGGTGGAGDGSTG